uniref:histidine kinase n=1 Tax=Thermosporothrix sp. COM3 TaxID=2490863 RepID=A0A455SR54_9CHLR|nr:hypothetical protein KTC_46490 [Thermosporothrix sp. COM3]
MQTALAHFWRWIRSLSMHIKVISSMLFVALGAILLLSLVTSLAIQSYFYNTHLRLIQNDAELIANSYIRFYITGDTTKIDQLQELLSTTSYLVQIFDHKGNMFLCNQPIGYPFSNCEHPVLPSALKASLQGETRTGYAMIPTLAKKTSSTLYISKPLELRGENIGALVIVDVRPDISDLLNQINQTILITAIIIGIVVLLFSLLLARHLTSPLKGLTLAAEKMKRGQYTQRVDVPPSHDELGMLARTFNEMADTIEADVNELHRQEQFRRELLANIAHDLATPLTAIQGFSEALADDIISDPAQRQETAQRIGREVQRLRRMVADLQQVTALESGRTTLDLAPLNIHTLVEETLAVIAPECEQMGLTVRNEIDPHTPQVQADSDRITQVLLNLLDNARRHTPPGGTIVVGAEPRDNYLHIHVSDTGSGIAPEALPHIFERFYRADRSRTGKTGGSGLGLAIVKAIITAHKGTIHATSTPHQGTSITFTLPLVANSQSQQKIASKTA